MEQKITVKHEVGVIIPRLTNPATPEDVVRNKQYIDGQGVVQKGTRPINKLVADYLVMSTGATPRSGDTTLGGLIDDIQPNESNLVAFSARKRDTLEPGEIGYAGIDRDGEWSASQFVAHNYFDPDTMSEPSHPETPEDGWKDCIVPLDGYVGDLICSLEGSAGISGKINSFHAFDADGNDLGVLVTDSDPNSKIQVRDGGGNVVRSGRIMTIPEGAATLRFKWNWKFLSSTYTELMVTHGDSIGATYVPYGDGWVTITDLNAPVHIPSGSAFDYFWWRAE